MARVQIPEGDFTGVIVGVSFADGVAEDVPEGTALAYFRRHGYIVEEAEPKADYPDGEPTKDWKVDELKAWAKANDRDLTGATTKPDIQAALGVATGDPA